VAEENIQIKGIGLGLRLSDTSILSVDSVQNFSWFGRHVFSEPVQFSGAQKFSIEQFFDPSASLGTIYWNNGASIQKATPIQPNKVLFFDGSRVSWGSPSVDSFTGTLSVGRGGTGLSSLSRGEILFASSNNVISGLSIGLDGYVLTSKNGLPQWSESGNVRASELVEGYVPVAISSNVLSNSLIKLTNNMVEFSHNVKIGSNLIISSSSNRALLKNGNNGITIHNNGLIEIGNAHFDSSGRMASGSIPATFITGTMPVLQGGTGISGYNPGDLLYADYSGSLNRLSAPSGEGWVLGVSTSGLPAWVDIANVRISGGNRRVKLETDGISLFFVNDNRQRVLISPGSNQSSQSGSVIPIHLGGTGDNLSSTTRRGALLVGRTRDAWTGLQPGLPGQVLSSNGVDEIPQWIEPPIVLKAKNGLVITGKEISIDANYSFNWNSRHKFDLIESRHASIDILKLNTVSNPASPSVGSMWTNGDDVYIQTKRGQRALVSESTKASNKRIIVLSLAQALDLNSEKANGYGVVVPFSPSNPLSATKWKILRVDCLPIDLSDEMRFQVKRNDVNIFENALRVHNTFAGCVDFVESIVTSGDTLRLYLEKYSASGFLNVTVLMEEYHG
jgi:hypothetical protein